MTNVKITKECLIIGLIICVLIALISYTIISIIRNNTSYSSANGTVVSVDGPGLITVTYSVNGTPYINQMSESFAQMTVGESIVVYYNTANNNISSFSIPSMTANYIGLAISIILLIIVFKRIKDLHHKQKSMSKKSM